MKRGREKQRNAVRQAKAIYFVASAVMLSLGIVLWILKPSMLLMRILMGIAFLLVGGSKIFGFFSNDLYKLAFQFDLAMGILSVLVGIVLLVRGNLGLSAAASIVGIYVMAESLFRIQTALDARKFGMKKWVLILITALLVGIVGVLILVNPFEWLGSVSLIVLMGIALIVDGAENIWITAYTVRVKAKKKNVEDRYESYF